MAFPAAPPVIDLYNCGNHTRSRSMCQVFASGKAGSEFARITRRRSDWSKRDLEPVSDNRGIEGSLLVEHHPFFDHTGEIELEFHDQWLRTGPQDLLGTIGPANFDLALVYHCGFLMPEPIEPAIQQSQRIVNREKAGL